MAIGKILAKAFYKTYFLGLIDGDYGTVKTRNNGCQGTNEFYLL